MKKYPNKKINVLVIGGGVSPEHTISVVSSSSVAKNLDREKYNVNIVGIGKEKGEWRYYGDTKFYTDHGSIDSYSLSERAWEPAIINPGSENVFMYKDGDQLVPFDVDVVFPVVHGENCEDGTLQGVIEVLGLPIVGCNTLSSALCMDKDLTKIVAKYNSIPVVPWLSYTKRDKIDVEHIIKELGLPLFVKPSSAGSSVGITKVKEKGELKTAVDEAFKYSSLVLIEKGINAKEIEFAVLGKWDKEVKVSIPGEIVPLGEFYSYEAKYIDAKGADLLVPADIDEATKAKIAGYARSVFKVLRCSGMARTDFFVDRDTKEIYFNEINTIPGFTTISMYPRLWNESGLSYSKLLDELITVALED
ncbi:MAG: D-alanine--D-alanine ligase family protein [bacterium]